MDIAQMIRDSFDEDIKDYLEEKINDAMTSISWTDVRDAIDNCYAIQERIEDYVGKKISDEIEDVVSDILDEM